MIFGERESNLILNKRNNNIPLFIRFTEDIEIVFLEEMNNEVTWESKGEFSTNNVHKQVAIVFKTPPYKDPNVSDRHFIVYELFF